MGLCPARGSRLVRGLSLFEDRARLKVGIRLRIGAPFITAVHMEEDSRVQLGLMSDRGRCTPGGHDRLEAVNTWNANAWRL